MDKCTTNFRFAPGLSDAEFGKILDYMKEVGGLFRQKCSAANEDTNEASRWAYWLPARSVANEKVTHRQSCTGKHDELGFKNISAFFNIDRNIYRFS